MNRDAGLSFHAGGEVLGCRSRNGAVALDDLGYHSAESFNAQGERGHVQQQHVLGHGGAAGEDMRLHGRAERHHFVRIQFGMGLALEQLFHQCMHPRNTRGAAYEDDFIDLVRLEFGIGQRLLTWLHRALDDGLSKLLKTFARNGALVTFALRQLNINVSFCFCRERDLGFDNGLAQGLHRFATAPDVKLQIIGNVIHGNGQQAIIDVIAAQVSIAIGGHDLKDAFMELEDGDIEGAATQIVDGDNAVFLLI